MILSFKGKAAEAIFQERNPGKGFPTDLVRPALRKLVMLNAAVRLEDLRAPPGNRLEPLTGDRAGQHSIRIKAKGGAENVEIVDYH